MTGKRTAVRVTHAGETLRFWVVVLALTTIAALASGCSLEPQQATEFEMPIELRNADEVGSVQFDLMYDPDVLRLLEVVIAAAPSTTMIDFNTDDAGWAVIGIVDEEGIDGDALSLSVRFSILQKGAGCSVTVENVVAYDAATVSPVSASSTSGEFRGDAGLVTPPVLVFAS